MRQPSRFPAWALTAATVGVLALASPASALFSDNLRGNLTLAGVSSKAGDESTRSLDQEYMLTWSKSLVNRLQTRLSMRYFNVGVDQSLGENNWRHEYQPTGEIIWSHPKFILGGSIRRQKSTTNNELTDLIRDNAGLSLTTRLERYPLIKLRYDWDRAYNDLRREDRDTRERRFQGGLQYSLHGQSVNYSLTRRINENLASRLEITETNHLFRWNQAARLFQKRLRVNTGYGFSYRSQTTETHAGGTALIVIPFVGALYASDPTPEFGELDTLRSLGDGNVTDPTQPAIDVGSSLIDRNVGLDFGLPTDANALYIYTDRPSGSAVAWRLYLSDDNITWSLLTSPAAVTFNASFNRYEITFPIQRTRYIKAVNAGFNDVTSVLITEIQPLIGLDKSNRETMKQNAHTVNVGATYAVTPTLESSADFAYQNEPRGDFNDSRNQIYYMAALKHKPSPIITHIVRYQIGFEDFKRGTRNDNASLSYTLLMNPLAALDFSFAAMNRMNYIDHAKVRETNNLSLQATGGLLPGLNLSGEAGYNRDDRFDARYRFDTWSYRVTADAALLRSLEAVVYYLYQGTDGGAIDAWRIRRQYSADLTYRLTPAILWRGEITVDDDQGRRYVTQEYDVSWNITERITTGALVTIAAGDNNIRSERSNVRLTYAIGSRGSLFMSYVSNTYATLGRSRVTSLQTGFKLGF